jgi:hypothetical protein
MALPVFDVTWLFAHQHNGSGFRAFAENRLRGILIEIAALTRLSRLAQACERAVFGEELGSRSVVDGFSHC